jgi:prolyl oligopeptidase
MNKFLIPFALLPVLAAAAPPVAPIKPVVTNYYGTPVTDNYRWMEAGGAPFAAYLKGQGAYARQKLDSIPGRAQLLKEIAAEDGLSTYTEGLVLAGGKYFYLQIAPGQNSAKLWVRDAATGATKMLVDPDTFGKGAEAINFFQPSQDGKFVAYGVSAGGSEAATLRVLATATGADQGVAIDRVDGDNSEFLPVWWLPDNDFAYYRLQKLGPKDDPDGFFLKSRVWLHHLGANPQGDGDTALFGYNVDASVPVAPDQDALVMSLPGSPYGFGVLTENESSNVIDAIYVTPMAALEAGKPVWTKLAGKGDNVTQFDAQGAKFFALTYKDAPRYKVVETDLTKPDLAHATVVMAQSGNVIRSIAVAQDGLYAVSSDGGFSQVVRMPWGAGAETLPLPYAGTVAALVTDETAPGAVFSLESWTRSALWYRNAPDGSVTDSGLQPAVKVDTSGVVSREVMATSYDGTAVPLSIIMPAGAKLDGTHPTLLIGYGSYGITITPGFSPASIPWFKHGGIIAFAHVRGGGWYGEDWHKAGMKLTKLNTVFDFIACAQYLEDQHYTSAKYLTGEGGSAGGITIGGAIDWAPQLFAGAIDSHGMTDTLRSEFTPNGPPNISEFGTVTNETGFHGLYAMSAYAHVRDGTKYPAVLLETGANDPRVEPWEVAKMTARLQAASASGKPIIMTVSYDSGHGIGDTLAQEDSDLADEFSFVLWQAGAKGFQPVK